MANGDGIAYYTIKIYNDKHHETFHYLRREVYWARYVDWSTSCPSINLTIQPTSFPSTLSFPIYHTSHIHHIHSNMKQA